MMLCQPLGVLRQLSSLQDQHFQPVQYICGLTLHAGLPTGLATDTTSSDHPEPLCKFSYLIDT